MNDEKDFMTNENEPTVEKEWNAADEKAQETAAEAAPEQQSAPQEDAAPVQPDNSTQTYSAQPTVPPVYAQQNYNGANQYAQQQNYYAPTTPIKNTEAHGMAVASMVLGIVGIVCCCCCGLGLIASVIGLILGIVAKSRGNNEGFSLAGIILNAIGLAFGILGIMYWIAVIRETGSLDYEEIYRDIYDRIEEERGNGYIAILSRFFK